MVLCMHHVCMCALEKLGFFWLCGGFSFQMCNFFRSIPQVLGFSLHAMLGLLLLLNTVADDHWNGQHTSKTVHLESCILWVMISMRRAQKHIKNSIPSLHDLQTSNTHLSYAAQWAIVFRRSPITTRSKNSRRHAFMNMCIWLVPIAIFTLCIQWTLANRAQNEHYLSETSQ